jgi:hypothetical protein
LSKGAATYTVNCTDDGLGNFTNCNIPGPKGKGQKLKGGLSGKTYWVSVVVNMPFLTGQGQWGFGTDTTIHGNEGNWQNPGGGFGTPCTTWDTNTNCVGIPGDYAFDLQGHL